jgi:T5SS/PEP-CTERM-associated repeat protein
MLAADAPGWRGVSMAGFDWFGGSGDLSVAGNWIQIEPPPEKDQPSQVVPGPDDGVLVSGSGTLTGSGDYDDFDIGSGAFVLEGSVTAELANVGGNLSISGSVSAPFAIDGAVTVVAGGTINSPFNGFSQGIQIYDSGTLTVDGATAVVNTTYLLAGGPGSGQLQIIDGGQVTANGQVEIAQGDPTESGEIAISGAGSELTVVHQTMTVGGYGNGVLSVTNGGQLSTFILDVGSNDGGSGSVVIDGASTVVTLDGLNIAGAGLVQIEGGATVTDVSTAATVDVVLNAAAGTTAELDVDGQGSSLDVPAEVMVGGNGEGELSVTDGATLTAGSILLAEDPGSSGTLILGASDLSITDGGGLAVVDLTEPSAFTGSISGFAVGDSIDVEGVANVVSVLWSNGVLAVNAGGSSVDISLPGNFIGALFAYAPDGDGGTDVMLGAPRPSLQVLGDLANAVYGTTAPDGWQVLTDPDGKPLTATDASGEFKATAYLSPDGSQIVLAVRGTDLVSGEYASGFQNALTDIATWGTGTPSPEFQTMVAGTSNLLAQIIQDYPGLQITLTGHSLGGAVVQLVSQASGYNAEVFNAPGAGALYSQLTSQLAPAASLFSSDNGTGLNVNFRTEGDGVSLVGTPMGTVQTLEAPSVSSPFASTPLVGLLYSHLMGNVLLELNAPDLTTVSGIPSGDSGGAAAAVLEDVAFGTVVLSQANLVRSAFSTVVSAAEATISGAANVASAWFDPGAGNQLIFAESGGSPPITSVSFVADPDVAQYVVWEQVGGAWSNPQTVVPGGADQTAVFGAGVSAFMVEAESATDQQIEVPNGLIFNATFAAAGQVNATATTLSGPGVPTDFNNDGRSDLLIENTSGAVVVGEVENGQAAYVQVAGLGVEWTFHGSGDFLGDGNTGFLIQNAAGAVDVGEVLNGQTSYTLVAALGPEWSFEGNGDFLGHGDDQFLIENTSGAVVVGEMVSGQAQYTTISALGSEWSFRVTGDFLGDGVSDFLIENAAGAVVVGEVANGQAAYTTVGALGPEWSFRESGDFLGDGKSDVLIENAAGAVDVGEVVNGQAQYTAITALGPEWKFVGAGDYLGEGHDQFLIENAVGAVDVGDWLSGQIHFTQVAALGSEWAFH